MIYESFILTHIKYYYDCFTPLTLYKRAPTMNDLIDYIFRQVFKFSCNIEVELEIFRFFISFLFARKTIA